MEKNENTTDSRGRHSGQHLLCFLYIKKEKENTTDSGGQETNNNWRRINYTSKEVLESPIKMTYIHISTE